MAINDKIIGKEFGLATVISSAGVNKKPWIMQCRCQCGTYFTARSYDLVDGKQKSCGCHRKKLLKSGDMFRSHGESQSKEYLAWVNMRQRCYNHHAPNYKHYGKRGIVVCDKWRDSFEMFLADMGTAPSAAHSIDRKDNDGPYSPANCRWATKNAQNRNQRSNIHITIDGKTKVLGDWLKEYDRCYLTYQYRVKHGWTQLDAIVTSPHDEPPSNSQI